MGSLAKIKHTVGGLDDVMVYEPPAPANIRPPLLQGSPLLWVILLQINLPCRLLLIHNSQKSADFGGFSIWATAKPRPFQSHVELECPHVHFGMRTCVAKIYFTKLSFDLNHFRGRGPQFTLKRERSEIKRLYNKSEQQPELDDNIHGIVY